MIPMTVVEVGTLLAENAPAIEAVAKAVAAGFSHASIVRAIEAMMVQTSDDAMRAELAAK
jgi:hypothetical protein